MNPRIVIGVGVLAALAGWAAWSPKPDAAPNRPAPAPHVAPDCPDGKCPVRPVRPILPVPVPRRPWVTPVGATVGGPKHPDGTELQLDLPTSLHQRNSGGNDNPRGSNPRHEPGKGSGLCVLASARHSGLWADEPCFSGMFEWGKRRPGGYWPEKFDASVAAYCAETGTPRPDYLQVQNDDLGILRQACAAGLMPAVTTMRHSHMISLVHADDRHFVTLDNNLPGKYRWQSPEEFRAAYLGGQSKGWAVIPLRPGPPPVPRNAQELPVSRSAMIAAPLIVATAMVAVAGDGYRWQTWPDGTESALMLDGRQVGSWDVLGGYYRPILPSGEWGAKADLAPVAPPVPTGGVDAAKMCDHEECYTRGGVRIDRVAAERAVEDARIPDLAGKLRMVVIGEKSQTAPVVADFTSPAQPWASALIVQAYAPDHWHVAPGFAKGGSPSITVTDEAGVVVWRQDDYAGGAAALASAIAATPAGKLRVPHPDYDPSKDPNPKLHAAKSGGVGLALAGILLYLRTRKA